jgi:hypothetical protein
MSDKDIEQIAKQILDEIWQAPHIQRAFKQVNEELVIYGSISEERIKQIVQQQKERTDDK